MRADSTNAPDKVERRYILDASHPWTHRARSDYQAVEKGVLFVAGTVRGAARVGERRGGVGLLLGPRASRCWAFGPLIRPRGRLRRALGFVSVHAAAPRRARRSRLSVAATKWPHACVRSRPRYLLLRNPPTVFDPTEDFLHPLADALAGLITAPARRAPVQPREVHAFLARDVRRDPRCRHAVMKPF